MIKRLIPLVTMLVLCGTVYARPTHATATPTPSPQASCVPSASITEYYYQPRQGTGTSQVLTTLTKPVVVSGTFADYHNAEPPCSDMAHELVGPPTGTYNCPQWEIPTLIIEGPNPLGAIDDADVNSTIQLFDIRDGDPYNEYTIPSINPSSLQYVNEPSPLWTLVSETMDGTCYKDEVKVTFMTDVLETSGPTYSLQSNLCESNNAECNEMAEGRGGAATDEHWGVVAKDNQGGVSLVDVSAEIGEDSRGTCGQIGGANSGGWETISNSGNSTCPGDQNAN